jgi:nucleoside-diphosphate-sugar epimerase
VGAPLFRSVRWRIAPCFTGKNAFSVCYIEDVSQAIADLAESPLSSDEIFCLDDGAVHTWRSLSKAVSLAMGKKALSLPIPKTLFKLGAGLSQAFSHLSKKPTIFTLDKIKEMEQPSWVCGYERLLKIIGWKPRVTLNEGLKKTRRYYQKPGFFDEALPKEYEVGLLGG